MTDRIRVTNPTVVRPTTIGDRHPLVMNADGSTEVREPTPLSFAMVKTSVAANTANQGVNHTYSTSNVTALMLPKDSRLVGLSVACQSALTAGTLTVKPQRSGGGSVPGATVTLTTGDQRKSQWWGHAAGFPFLASETFGLVLDTDAAFAPTTNMNVLFWLFFSMQP